MYVGDVLKAVLSLYMRDPKLPLPSSAEVCICTSTTTAEEVNNFFVSVFMKLPLIHSIPHSLNAKRMLYYFKNCNDLFSCLIIITVELLTNSLN